MEVRALTWNLFHGRDHPPEAELRTLRSRILRTTERGEAHAQVNRDLRESFVAALVEAEWDVALLQECPPRWAERLATACGAEPHLALTSRNLPGLGRVQGLLADWSPDLIASWEGGSNLTLVRTSMIAGAGIAERRTLQLARRPERRVMAFSRLAGGICVANLHASAEREAAELEVVAAARAAVTWADGWPVVLGGDFNLRPALSGHVFATLADELGLAPATGPRVIDHLLSRDLDVIELPHQWSLEQREASDPTAGGGPAPPIVLSDHAPVEALLATS